MAIVYEPVRMIGREELTEMLDSPLRGRVLRNVGVKDAPGADFDGDEDVEQAERGGHGNEEVAGYDTPSLIPHKGLTSVDRSTVRVAGRR